MLSMLLYITIVHRFVYTYYILFFLPPNNGRGSIRVQICSKGVGVEYLAGILHV